LDERSICSLKTLDIDASLASHSKFKLIIINYTHSICVGSMSSFSSAFSCASLLAYLPKSLLLLLEGESARPGNFHIFIAHEMFLCFDGLLSLPKQMLEFHSRMRMLISTRHIGLFLDVLIVIRTSLYVLLDMSYSIRLIFPNIQLVKISAIILHLLAIPMSSFKALPLLSIAFSYSSIGNFISLYVAHIINPSQRSRFTQDRKSVLLPSLTTTFA
jgi:hypothetical protein